MNRGTLTKWVSGNTHFSECFYSGAAWEKELGELRLVVEGEFDERVAAFEFELLADVSAMVLDRAVADEEFRRDLFAGLFLCDQFQDAPLCGGEIVEAGLGFGERVRARGAIE